MLTIRLALTTVFILLSYKETGIWTSIMFLLVCAGLELQARTIHQHKKAIESLILALQTLTQEKK